MDLKITPEKEQWIKNKTKERKNDMKDKMLTNSSLLWISENVFIRKRNPLFKKHFKLLDLVVNNKSTKKSKNK